MMTDHTITQSPPARPLTPAEEQLAQAMAAIARRAKLRFRTRNTRRKASRNASTNRTKRA